MSEGLRQKARSWVQISSGFRNGLAPEFSRLLEGEAHPRMYREWL